MCFKEKVVRLSRIDADDDSFRITTENNLDDLASSIKHLGLLNLPLLLEQKTGYTIIFGFRRIEACRRLNWSEVSARVLNSDTDPLKCVTYAITDNTFQRPLNIIEKSRCIKMLSVFYKDGDTLTQVLPVLGISDHPVMIKKIKTVYDMPERLQNSILSNTISLPMALELSSLSRDDVEGFVKLFNALKLSLNKQREVLTIVKEIAVREDISVMHVLEASPLKEILTNKNLDQNQKTRNIRIYLKRRRFPAITAAEQSFQKHLKKLNTGKEMKLIPPVNFESSTYTLKLTFNNMTELKDLKTAFDALIENPHLKKIISDSF